MYVAPVFCRANQVKTPYKWKAVFLEEEIDFFLLLYFKLYSYLIL